MSDELVSVSAKITWEQYRALRNLADREDTTISRILRELVGWRLDYEKAPAPFRRMHDEIS